MAAQPAGAPTPADVLVRYDAGGLATVLPSVAASLGIPLPGPLADAGEAALLPLPPSRRAVVVLVDGLGLELLRRRGGHAPFLRSLLPQVHELTAGFPTTTATSMGTFGTGLPPGAHGLLGLEVLDPATDRLLNELSWEDGPDPFRWQPHGTVFEAAEAAGVRVTRVGPGYFDNSGLTNASTRGGAFRAARSLEDRVDASLYAVRQHPRSLVYLYWGEVDKTGHVHGVSSLEWGEELESVDRELRRLVASVPPDTAVVVTADHGMVDTPHDLRVDLADDAELAAGVRHAGGEPRALQLYCDKGSRDDVVATWRERLGERAWVLTREDVLGLGWFGGAEERTLPRMGDVQVVMQGEFTVVDSRHQRPELLALRALHGALTTDELSVPLLHVPARAT